jgi:hypothetical protein
MSYKNIGLLVGGVMVAVMAVMAPAAQAATPSFSVSYTGSGDNVYFTASGDANSSVNLFYNVSSPGGMRVETLGTTDQSGNLSMNFTMGTYGISAGYNAYVVVNGQQSPMQAWPATTSSTVSGNPSFSQTSVSPAVGQIVTVVSNGSSNAIFLSNNSNSSTASFSISGTTVYITGLQAGTTLGTICYTANSGYCTNISVTVGGSSQTITFGQNNVNIGAQYGYASVSISGGTGDYYILTNSAPSVLQASLSGTVISLTALTSGGSGTITVCSPGPSHCGTLNATVGNAGVTFSQTNPSLSAGQTITVSLSGGSTYYLSGTTSGPVQASVNGSTLSLYGAYAGSSNVTACITSGTCSTLFVTVTAATSTPSNTGSLSFGQVVQIGKSANLSISGGSAPYTAANNSPSIVAAVLAGTLLDLRGLTSGTATVTVCGASGGCLAIPVTVVPAVGGSSGGSTAAKYKFYNPLSQGMSGTEVRELQDRLTEEGFLTATPTGYYGAATVAAVKAFQKARGLAQLGNVGPGTRAELNK